MINFNFDFYKNLNLSKKNQEFENGRLGYFFVLMAFVWLLLTPAILSARADTKSVVVLGDSLVAGYGLASNDAFPDQLERALRARGYDISITNAGVSGDTTSGGLARLDWSVPQGTDAVILELGVNDALRGISPRTVAANLEAIIIRLQERGIKMLLAGMKAPPNMGEKYTGEFDAIYPALAKKFKLVFYPFFLEGVATVSEFNQSDGIHPTAEGVAVIVERFMPSAIKLAESLSG